jgi:type I restriction-modification system DNA methylase subunit
MDKTQYFSILKQLHDICRDSPAPTFTGMDAYNEIMNYLYLRHLSDNKDDIPDEHNLKSLYENYCTDKKIKEDLYNMDLNKSSSKSGIKKQIYFEDLSEKLLPGLINQNRNKNISFIKIMGDDINNFKLDIGRITNLVHKDDGASNTDGGQKAQKLINKIYEKDFLPLKDGKFDIKLFPYDALGEGFEKFMSDAGSSGGNWGQYFTNPQVINYLIEKVNIKKNDKLIDPFAGSGGFLLQAKYKSKIKSDNIYAHETDDKIYKFLKFNSNIADIKLDNIEKGDTFDYQDYLKENENKYDKILSNPPFGCSIEILLSGSKDKSAYWDIMKSGKYTIKDSMGLAVYAMYKMLKDGGVAGFVSERGILNNGTENKSWQKNLRKFILENTEIKEIMLLPKGIFSHTNFDTACIIFEKGKTTNQVVYHQGYFKDEDKGKGDKKMYIKENILTITLEQIVNKDWSLKYDDYIEKKDDSYEGITYKNLGEVCEFVRGKVLTSSDVEKNKGEYPVIGGGIKPFGYYKEYNMPEKSILISQSGANAGYVSRYNNKVWASDCFSVNYTNNDFMFYYLKLQQSRIMKRQSEGGLQTGQAQPHVKCGDMEKFKIPILPQDHQERIVEYMDKIFGSDYKKLDKLVSKFKDYDLFKILLNNDYTYFDNLMGLYDNINDISKYIDNFNIIKLDDLKIYALKLYNSVNKIINKNKELENEEYETIQYKDKLYILECDKLYNINEDDTKGKIFGSYIDGKVKKIKICEVLVV